MIVPLVVLGSVFTAAGIIGTGLKAANTEIPVIASKRRQFAIASFGIVVMAIGIAPLVAIDSSAVPLGASGQATTSPISTATRPQPAVTEMTTATPGSPSVTQSLPSKDQTSEQAASSTSSTPPSSPSPSSPAPTAALWQPGPDQTIPPYGVSNATWQKQLTAVGKTYALGNIMVTITSLSMRMEDGSGPLRPTIRMDIQTQAKDVDALPYFKANIGVTISGPGGLSIPLRMCRDIPVSQLAMPDFDVAHSTHTIVELEQWTNISVEVVPVPAGVSPC